MAAIAKFYSLIVLLFSCITLVFTSEDICVKRGPCTCVFVNGTGFDLSPSSASSTFFSAQQFGKLVDKNGAVQYKLNDYFYHPCKDAPPSFPSVPSGYGTCSSPMALCRLINTMVQTTNNSLEYKLVPGNFEYMGSQNYTEFSANGHSITYHNGPSATTVELICADSEDKLHVLSLSEPNNIVLSFYSRNACLKQIEEVGRSFGSTLLIIFFSLVIFYLVLGVCTKKFLMGATGVEVIPNLAFWMDLPNLVKDGWSYARNGFKLPPRGAGPATTPDPNSYDSI